MRWDESLATGNAVIDAEHRELIALIDELELADTEADETRVPQALEQLADYVAVHFQMEERLMRREGYPAAAIEAHVAEHRELARRTSELEAAYAAGTLDSVDPIVEFLYEWFQHHIAEVDQQLADHVRERTRRG
jgi:hemerythrin